MSLEMLLCCLVGVLILYGLGQIFVLVIVAMTVLKPLLQAHSMFVDRVSGFADMFTPPVKTPEFTDFSEPKQQSKPEELEPDLKGFEGHFRYFRNPKTGRQTLMPKDEADLLEKELAIADEDEQWTDDWVDGKEQTTDKWKAGVGRNGGNTD